MSITTKSEYSDFAALLEGGERENVNFRRRIRDLGSNVAIVAPHGGNIEPETDGIAAAIAGSDWNLYCFLGVRSKDANKTLHVTSARFDDPKCIALLRNATRVVTVHGLRGVEERVDVGGRDVVLRDSIVAALNRRGFVAWACDNGDHAGIDPNNICNRGASGMGAQLEITRALRDRLRGEMRNRFADTIRAAITDAL